MATSRSSSRRWVTRWITSSATRATRKVWPRLGWSRPAATGSPRPSSSRATRFNGSAIPCEWTNPLRRSKRERSTWPPSRKPTTRRPPPTARRWPLPPPFAPLNNSMPTARSPRLRPSWMRPSRSTRPSRIRPTRSAWAGSPRKIRRRSKRRSRPC